MTLEQDDVLMNARNSLVTVSLALDGLAERAPDLADEILSLGRVFDDALRDMDRSLALDATKAP
jgi:hypothetical protein